MAMPAIRLFIYVEKSFGVALVANPKGEDLISVRVSSFLDAGQ